MAGAEGLRAVLERRWWAHGPTSTADILHGLWLRPLSALYGLLTGLRRQAHARGWRSVRAAPVPVIVVGNLVAGGAGKTPTTLSLVAALQRAGWHPGVVSRGHGGAGAAARPVQPDSTAPQVGDEPLLLRRRSGVPVWVGHDRAATALALCRAEPAVDVIVADDGLQHLGLHRDAQVLVIDRRGFGNGQLLPAGPLREPAWAALPPRTVVVYNAPQPVTALPGHVASARLGVLLSLTDWWAGRPEAAIPLAALADTPLVAAAAIAEPRRFFDLLAAAGLRPRLLPLPDHAPLDDRPWGDGPERILVTEKDAVKLPPGHRDAARIVVVALDFALPEAVLAALLSWLPAPPPLTSARSGPA